MAAITPHTEESTATIIYHANSYNQPTEITFLIGDYLITIDTTTPGAASWDYLSNSLYMNPEEIPPRL